MNPLACESRWIFYIYNLKFLNIILYLYCNKISNKYDYKVSDSD